MSWNHESSVPHPSAVCLLAYEDGMLSEEEASEIESHLESCAACCDALAGLPEDDFLIRLRHASENAPALEVHTPPLPPASPRMVSRSGTATFVLCRADAPVPPGYRDIRKVGHGGMGVVYAALHALMNRRVAVKVIHPEFSCNARVTERFRREACAAARLSHPNIVTLHDAGEHEGQPFLIMEFVDGENLSDILDRQGPLSVAEACDAVRQAAMGVQHAHENGLIHRDLKPHNLIRTPNGTVKVCDFGLAALVDDHAPASRATAPNALMGTPDYMAPEQAEDARAADGRSDVYALGCTLYHLLTGTVPFPEESVLLKLVAHRTCERPRARRLRPEIPPELDTVLRRAMARAPQDRFQTPGELAEALRPFTDTPRLASGSQSFERERLAVPALLILGVVGTAVLVCLASGRDRQVVIKPDNPDGPREQERAGVAHESSLPDKIEAPRPPSVDQRLWLDGYAGPVWSVAFSPDGRYTLTTGQRNFLHERPSRRLVRRLGAGIWVAAFSPDGKRTLTGDLSARSLILSETDTGKIIHSFGGLGLRGQVRYATFSPDGKLVAASEGDTVRLYDAATGRPGMTAPTHQECRPAFTFTADSRHLLVIHSSKRSIHTYDVKSGVEAGLALVSPSPLSALAVSRDGQTVLATGFEPHSDDVFVWNRTNADLIGPLSAGERLDDHYHRQAAFLPDGQRALVTSSGFNGTMTLWDIRAGRPLHRWDRLGSIVSLAVSPDGRWALCGLFSQRAFLLPLPEPSAREQAAPSARIAQPDAAAARSTWRMLVAHRHMLADRTNPPSGHTYAAAFSPHGTMYALGGDDSCVRLWSQRSGDLLHVLRGHTGPIRYITFSLDGKRLVSSGDDRTLRVWDTGTGRQVQKLLVPDEGAGSVEASPDGRRLLSGSPGDTVRIWDIESGQELLSLKAGKSCGAVFTQEGKHVVTWSGGDTLKLWDAATGKLLKTASDQPASVLDCRPVRGGTILLVARADALSWRDPATLCEVRRLELPGLFDDVCSLNWDVSPDGHFLVSAYRSETGARLWDLQARTESCRIALPHPPRGRLAFAPDGRHVAACSLQGFAYLLRIEIGNAPVAQQK